MNIVKAIVKLAGRFAVGPMIGVVMAFALADAGAQQIPLAGTMEDFSSSQYFDPPYQQQVKSRISGAEAQEITEELWLIKRVKIEKFDVTGKLQVVAEAPECIYDRVNAVANSAGELHIHSGDGQWQTNGEGFLWHQTDGWLIISNETLTVIAKGPAIQP